VQAFKWFRVTVSGRDTHAGTTPFSARKDALLCAAKLIVHANTIAKRFSGLATTGIIEATPGSINTMAHTVVFTLDIRHTEDAKLAAIEIACKADFSRIATEESEKGCEVKFQELVDSPAVVFHDDCIRVVEESAEEVCKELSTQGLKAKDNGSLWKYMISGAGHDSCYTNRRCPTSMIFSQTKEGISHNPREYCSPEDW
jgi:acetylornithine deacetylase/succinyl-diaminopimelate desuccinylase-like protein